MNSYVPDVAEPYAGVGDLLSDPASSIEITGRWLKQARIRDEEWLPARRIPDPVRTLNELRSGAPSADLFTFSQRCTEPDPRYHYPLEWNNEAVVRTDNYDDWWENRLPQVTRKNVRRGYKRGVRVTGASFDDKLVEGITRIYNETPIRQGRRFRHYGKDQEAVRRDNSSYLDRSDFIAAYHGEELIGFIKVVYVDNIARIMQILALDKHADKRPTNLLLAKAVEVCCEKKMSYLVFGKFIYGKKLNSPVTEFKRRNGFERVSFPTYHIPLTIRGKLAMTFKLHLGMENLLPEKMMNAALGIRSRVYNALLKRQADDNRKQEDNL